MEHYKVRDTGTKEVPRLNGTSLGHHEEVRQAM